MEVEIVVAIVSSSVAVLTAGASLVNSFIQGRKARVAQVVLANRVKTMDEMRVGFTNFIGLANKDAIKAAQNNPEVLKIFSDDLFLGYGKIKTYIKPFFPMDKELLKALDELYYCILAAFNGDEEKQNKLDGLREDFADKYLKYDWAYWRYIQRQREGNYMDSTDAFDKVYKEFMEELEKKNNK